MAKKFDLSEFMRPGDIADIVSESDTGERRAVMIPVGSIRPNEKNFYAVDDVSGLIDSILIHGVLDPATVRPDGKGGYVLISGHRRYTAVKNILDEKLCGDPTRFERMPCFVVEPKDELLEELMLIQANSSTRVLTASEVSRQAERVEDILYRLREQGYEFPGRMRDHVAEACRVSSAKLARLKVIRGGLCPEYKERFDADKLPEQTAYALARLPADFQQRLFGIDSAPNGGAVERIAKRYADDGWRWEPDKLTCPDGSACRRGNAFLRHDLSCLITEQCGGNKCCLTCDRGNSSYAPCDRACSKLQAQRKAEREDKIQTEAREKEKRQTKLKAEIRHSCERIARAADRAGLADDVSVSVDTYKLYTVGEIRAFAQGSFGDKFFYTNVFTGDRLHGLPELCRILQCSADYLVGISDSMDTAQEAAQPGMCSGSPSETGWYAARFDCEGYTLRRLAWYDKSLGNFYFDKSCENSIDAECTGWVPLPEDF